MAVCDPNTLLEEGACFGCLATHQLELIQAQLLCNLLNLSDPMASCDPNTLLAEGKCFACLNSHQLRIVIAQLLCNLVDVGTVSNIAGNGPPAADGVFIGQQYSDLDAGGQQYVWNGSAWI